MGQDAEQGGVAAEIVERLVDVGIDGLGPFHAAQAVADAARRQHPDVEQAIDAVVGRHVGLAAVGGFVTGLGGFVTLPVALPANVAEFFAVATRMVGAVAALRGYDLREPGVRSAVMLTLVGADVDDLLRQAGVPSGGRILGLVTQRLPGPAAMVVNKGIGFRVLTATGRSLLGPLGKGVPVVGGAIGAGLDAYLLRRIAENARRELPARSSSSAG
ncbi:MAG TPA: hypothetical protein VKB14_06760 [Actinomycetales bacterium]|nr:hypothetical protein [Actinomycetales bacterium]